MRKESRKRVRQSHKTDPSKRAVLKFTVFHDPESDQVPLNLTSEKPATKLLQDRPVAQIDLLAVTSSTIGSQTKSAESRAVVNPQTPSQQPGSNPSDKEEERRFASAKPIKALVSRGNSRSTALYPVDSGSSLLRWRRAMLLLYWLKSLPLWQFAKLTCVLLIYGVIFGGLIYFGIKTWKRFISSPDATQVAQRKESKKSGQKKNNRALDGKNPHGRGTAAISKSG